MKNKLNLICLIVIWFICQGQLSLAAFEPITPAGMYFDKFNIGDLVKISGHDSLYYLGADGKRYSFPNEKTYFTWYSDFSRTKIISATDLANIPFGGSITYRAGLKMIKIQSIPTVYVVSHGAILRAIPNEQTAQELYGTDWNKKIDDISDAFWNLYQIGPPLTQATDYDIKIETMLDETINQDKELEITSAYKNFILTTSQGAFTVSVTELNLDKFSMLTDTATLSDCSEDCPAKSLQDYLTENNGLIGIHGTYFCPPDYNQCSTKINSFDWPVYNSKADVMINEARLLFHEGPLIATDTNDQFYYFHRAKDFGNSIADFENNYNTSLNSAISNYPSLIENGRIVVNSEPMDTNQKTVKGTRGGIGYNNQYVILVIASSATVPDLAYILQTLGADYAMNLDGGGSVAMMFDNFYVYGPGRLLPNAVIFKAK